MADRYQGLIASALALGAAMTIGCGENGKAVPRKAASSPSPSTIAVPTSGSLETAVKIDSGPVSFADGESAYQARNYGEATRIFTRLAEQRPEHAWGQFMLGLSAWKAGDRVKAEAAFNEALRHEPDHVRSLVNLSRVLIEQGRTAEAIDRLVRADELTPESGEVHRLFGRAYHAQGKPEEAIAAYRKAIELDESDSWAMNNLGLLFLEQGRPGDAVPLLTRAVELDNSVAVFHNNLGMALEHTGNFPGAAAAYSSALAAAPDYEKAQKNLARVEKVKVPVEPADPVEKATAAAESTGDTQGSADK
jgi:Tfp pilus assembly protein PilF